MVTSSQHHRALRVEMHDKTDHRRRPTQQWSAIADMCSAIETGSEVKKCSLTVIGKVPAPVSRMQTENLSLTLLTVELGANSREYGVRRRAQGSVRRHDIETDEVSEPSCAD